MGSQKVYWDQELDWLLTEMDKRGMSYNAIGSALSVTVGFEISGHQVRWRLRNLAGAGGSWTPRWSSRCSNLGDHAPAA